MCGIVGILIEGNLNVEALKEACQKSVNQYEILRTIFHIPPEIHIPIQSVIKNAIPTWQELDLRHYSSEKQESFIKDFSNKDEQFSLNVEAGSLLFLTLITLSTHKKYILFINLPSLCADAKSMNNLFQIICGLYNANHQQDLDLENIQYVQFSAWHNELLKSEDSELGRKYWQSKKNNDFLNLKLPFEFKKAEKVEFKPQVIALTLHKNLVNNITTFIQNHKTTKFVLFLSCWQILLSRLTGQSDIVIGTICDGRPYQELERALGLFAKYLPIHSHLEEDDCFVQVLKKVDKSIIEAYSWQEFFDSEENFKVTDNSNQLFCFDFDKYQSNYLAKDVSFLIQKQYICFAPFKIKLACIDQENTIDLEFYYDSTLFSGETIEILAGQFNTLLESIIINFNLNLSKLQIISIAEKQKLLFDCNNTKVEYQNFQCIHQLFEAQVKRTPHAIGVVFEGQALTYQELNQKANQLACYLQKLGVKPEVLVGICLERSLEMVIGLLGLFKAGGAYVPLDPAYPQERLSFMLADTNTPVLLTQHKLANKLFKHIKCVVCLDTDWNNIAQESSENPISSVILGNLAYVIYTSGSTGNPKGVMSNHQGISNRLLWMQDTFKLTAYDRVLQKTPFSFDVSIWELFSPLLAGANLVLAKPGGHQDTAYLVELIAEQQITIVHFVPSMLALFLQESGLEKCQSLKRVFCSGEALGFDLQERFFARLDAKLYNLYGPTEASIEVTYWHCRRDSNQSIVPIGRAIANTQMYILDQHLQPVPTGVVGELHIGGVGLARGYLHRPDLTAEKFIANPFSDELDSRLYKTGDLGRYLPCGNIEYLGRIDDQVKIRGFRIELGEIEAVLNQHPAVLQATIQAQEDEVDGKRLVAYIVPNSELVPTIRELRCFLQQKLPDYMMPSVFIFLKTLPLTSSGKIDRKALATAQQLQFQPESSFVAPRTPAEEIVVNIWKQVLHLEKVGIQDNFFELGGHSLLAIQVISRLNKAFGVELSVRSLFEALTVEKLVEAIASATPSAIANISNGQQKTQTQIIPKRTETEPSPLSFAQQRLWFLNQLESDSFAYNISAAVRLKGRLNTIALHQSFNEIIRRHEALRTSFAIASNGAKPIADGQPVQIIAPSLTLTFPVINLGNMSEIEQQTEVQRLATSKAQQSFNLAETPLLRATLLQLNDTDHVLLFTAHHIVFDGWSIGIFIRELAVIYEAFSTGKPSPLPELPIQYADFALWQRQWLLGEVLKSQIAYWQQQLAGISPLQLPIDHPRPKSQTFRGAIESFSLSAKLTEALKALSLQEGVTLFMTLLTAFKTLLYRYSGQKDIAVGSPIANRNQTETENLIGFFVNTMVLRTDVSGNPSFRELLHRVRECTLSAYAHQDLPFEYLVEKLQPERNLNYNPIFQVMFAFQNAATEELKLPGLNLSFLNFDRQAATFDLSVSMQDGESGVEGTFEYNTDLFNADTISWMVEHFQILLTGIVDNAEQRLSDLPLLSVTEQQQLLVKWNNTKIDYPQNQCIHKLFEAQVELTPNDIAIAFEDQEITYLQLNSQANQLAHYLPKMGVGTEIIVGICLERSLEMVVGLLAILKAGGAYLPLDPQLPKERLAFMLENAQVSVLLTQEKLVAVLPEHRVNLVIIDADWQEIDKQDKCNPTSQVTTENLAYVIYTSGSTGRPKGVQILHSAVVNFLHSTRQTLQLVEQDILLSVTTLSFDIAVLEIFLPLIIGARVVIVSRGVAADAIQLSDALTKSAATVMQATPATWQMLVEAGWQGNSQLKILCGGEALPRNLANQLLQRCASLWNLYGPTETTIWSTAYKIETESSIVPIGRPLANTQIYILDQHGQLVPVGIAGELHIGGAGLARGYLNQPELTTQKFIFNHFSDEPGTRLYKTGDLARYLPNGDIEYLGRIDYQVKLRGFRIELGEIEAVLSQHPAVKQAVVLLQEDKIDNQQIVAYIVSRNQQIPTISELRNFLKQNLPDYMIPSDFVLLETLPLTPNGKVDRRRLSTQVGLHLEEKITYIAPQSAEERAIAIIWQAVLSVEKVGIHDNFFDLGGHSLLLVRVYSQLQTVFDKKDLSMMDLFIYPTISSLARYLNQNESLSVQPSSDRSQTRRDVLRQQRQRRNH
jgi:amino acid adenylation domain-containing protein